MKGIPDEGSRVTVTATADDSVKTILKGTIHSDATEDTYKRTQQNILSIHK